MTTNDDLERLRSEMWGIVRQALDDLGDLQLKDVERALLHALNVTLANPKRASADHRQR